MRIANHREKARRIDAARSRLEPRRDLELWLWSSASAGNHLLNAALHQFGITEEDDCYPTQVAGVYIACDASGGGTRRLLKDPGDVLHLGMPPLAGSLPSRLDPACDALARIEAAAERYIRGVEPASEEAIRECASAYTTMMSEFEDALESSGR